MESQPTSVLLPLEAKNAQKRTQIQLSHLDIIPIELLELINLGTRGRRVIGAVLQWPKLFRVIKVPMYIRQNLNFLPIFRPEMDTNMNLYCPSSFIITILWCKSWIQMHICTYLVVKPSIALSSDGFYYFSNFVWVLKTVPITGRPQALRFINSSTFLMIIPNCQSWIWTNIC